MSRIGQGVKYADPTFSPVTRARPRPQGSFGGDVLSMSAQPKKKVGTYLNFQESPAKI